MNEVERRKREEEFKALAKVKETCERLVPLTRAPQSWQYIEVEE